MADNKVRNNSPDVTQYHEGVAGMPGTMIPRAGMAGESLGFNPNSPNEVIVDPGEAGGGFTLNMDALAEKRKQFNSAAVRAEVAADPAEFYRGLAEAQKAPTKPKDSKLPTQPTSPRETDSASLPFPQPLPPINLREETVNAKQPLPDPVTPPEKLVPLSPLELAPENVGDVTGRLREILEEEKVKAQAVSDDRELLYLRKQAAAEAARVDPVYYDGGDFPPPLRDCPLPPPSPMTASSSDIQLRQLRSDMVQQRETINALIALQTEKASVVEDEVKQIEAKEAPEKVDLLSEIPFFEGDQPQRPQYETYFEMPKMGTMAARYHAVVDGQDCLALIYDTRFQDGFQYLPPNLGEERIKVSVPKLKNAVYSCSSLGLHWTLGCMDVVILIKHDEGEIS